MNIVWILTIIGCLVYLQPCCADLKLVQALFRHGNRMPTKGAAIYPKDPYINETYYPEGHGGLSNVGKMSAYKLGQFFRARYDEFLGPIYSKDIIWFRADEIDRIVMTGELVAAGLYPPYKEQIWNDHLNWQPIPVWAPPMSTDYLYNGMFCANFKKWRDEVETTDGRLLKFEQDHTEIYKYLSEHTGANITQRNTFNLRQILYAQRDIGLELPEWTESVFPNGKLDELAVQDILIRTRTTKLKQLTGGIWILEFLKHVDDYLNQNDKRKAFMYAGHELNIASILVTLKNFDDEIPSYSSSLMFELHENDNQHYVQILYRNNGKLRALNIPGCSTAMCPLETFKNFVAPVLPQNPAELCGSAEKSVLGVKQQSNY
ncbi:venom acid phosphatase Acph-1 [Nomia melanderi]|uniref:venom acid phosphatase Acph-1 n=1 Tax=Nomia melanderi TaxID=2448451 RepID=UPI001304056D|nr:venom acid phosphatase Acph-1-like [Nomia melanderi]